MLLSCSPQQAEPVAPEVIAIDPLAKDSFVMRNEEILENILGHLERDSIEHWVNEDGSIGFYVRDAETVDAIANEEIGVWVTLQ